MLYSDSLVSGAASVNGNIIPIIDAKIPLTDRGLLFGHGVFETLLINNLEPINWKEHYERLQNSCQKTVIVCPSEEKLEHECAKLLEYISEDKSIASQRLSLKIIITGGNCTELGMPIESTRQHPFNLYILCQPAPHMSLERRLQGLRVKSCLDDRGGLTKETKSTNYLFNFISLNFAKQKGFDDALLYDEEGYFTEGVTSSFVWFDQNHQVYSTPPRGNCLAGTSILKLKKQLELNKISFKYQLLNKNETTKSLGCALLSSVRGFVPISQIDETYFDVLGQSEFHKYLIEIMQS